MVEFIPRLCGGTFFALLDEARKNTLKTGHARTGRAKGRTEFDCMRDLIRIAVPSFYEDSLQMFKKNTTQYRRCLLSEFTGFDTLSWGIPEFDKRIRENYKDPFMLMDRFVTKYYDAATGKQACCALLDVILRDESIEEDAVFYSEPIGKPITKKELREIKNFTLAAFLLGAWHYVLTQRPDNLVGKETIENWYPDDSKVFMPYSTEYSQKAQERIGYFTVESFTTTGIKKNRTPEYNETGESGLNEKFNRYMDKVYDRYSEMKTLLYRNESKPFYGFYVCNDLGGRMRCKNSRFYRHETIHGFDARELVNRDRFNIITGTGGLGKSMMMRNLLLSGIKSYDELKLLPIFVPLKDFTSQHRDLVSYIYEKFNIFADDITEEELLQVLVSGKCILLLDGLDEINSAHRTTFERYLEVFADKYSGCYFVVSTRPYSDFISLSRFKVWELQPFTKEQAIQLIKKLDFRPDTPEIKERFLAQLEDRLYVEHRDFTANPLLLTIMLITFEQIAEVPEKMHVFYREAYQALSKHHDASKGAYNRELMTGLSTDRFRDVFEEFCARTYKEELFEMQESDIRKHFEATIEKSRYPEEKSIPVAAFIDDAVNALCLLYYENSCYNFTHRSFQEYFCACFFARQKDRGIEKIGEFFESLGCRSSSDKTFSMMYDMEPGKVEEFIFIPYISKLLAECRENEAYLTFLEKIYPSINYLDGDIGYEDDGENARKSFLYSFIARAYHFAKDIDSLKLKPYDELVIREYTFIEEESEGQYGCCDIVAIDEISEAAIKECGKPDVCGRLYGFDMREIMKDREYFSELIDQLAADTFPMKQEYNCLCKLLPELQERHRVKGGDLFDFF